MARRHASGAVKQRADGRWEGQLRLADGTRKYVYARNRRELITRLQEERWRLACGMPLRARGLSLADYSRQWLEVMRSRLRPTTYDGYELCLHRVVRRLGSVPIARLTPQLIQACYAKLLADCLSPRTVFHTHAVLHRALKQARDWGLTSGIPTELGSARRRLAAPAGHVRPTARRRGRRACCGLSAAAPGTRRCVDAGAATSRRRAEGARRRTANPGRLPGPSRRGTRRRPRQRGPPSRT